MVAASVGALPVRCMVVVTAAAAAAAATAIAAQQRNVCDLSTTSQPPSPLQKTNTPKASLFLTHQAHREAHHHHRQQSRCARQLLTHKVTGVGGTQGQHNLKPWVVPVCCVVVRQKWKRQYKQAAIERPGLGVVMCKKVTTFSAALPLKPEPCMLRNTPHKPINPQPPEP